MATSIDMRPDTAAGRIVGNAVITSVSNGRVCVTTSAPTDLVIDLFGWFGASGTRQLTAVGAERVLDTRTHAGRRVDPMKPLLVNAINEADVVNLTAADPQGSGFMVLHGCGALPAVSSVNVAADVDRPVLALAAAGTDGECITSSVATHVVIDRTARFSSR